MGFDSRNSGGREPGERVDVTLEFETMRQLQSALGPCLSTDGLFIETDDPAPEDSLVGFRAVLPDGFAAFQGTGIVIWRRDPGSADGPPGMAVQFRLVPGESRETIDAIIDAHLACGGELFDLERSSAGGDYFPTDALDGEGWRPSPSAEILDGLETARRMLGEEPGAPSTADPGVREVNEGEGHDEAVEISFDQPTDEPAMTAETEDAGDRELFEAISRAVSEPATGGDDAASEPPASEPAEDRGEEPTRAESDDTLLPEILDRFGGDVDLREDEVADAGAAEAVEEEQVTGGTEEREQPRGWAVYQGEQRAAPEPVVEEAPAETGETPVWVDSSAEREPRGWSRSTRWYAVAAIVVVGGLLSLMLWRWGSGTGGGEVGTPEPQSAVMVDEELPVAPTDQEDGAAAGRRLEPPAEARTEAPTPAPPQVMRARGTVIRTVTCDPRDGETQVVIQADGPLNRESVSFIPLEDPPRLLVRLRGIERGFSPHLISVGSAELDRVRIGHHPEQDPPALFVVLDLVDDSVRLSSSEVDGDVARVTVGR
jgi:hypothetical protein